MKFGDFFFYESSGRFETGKLGKRKRVEINNCIFATNGQS